MKTFILGLLFLVFSLPTYAFRVTPMTADFDAKGRGATQTFQIDNNSEKEVALEVEALTRKVDIDNKETREKTQDFMIYPLQLTVKPGEKKNIRVTYVGNEPENEIPFRLVVRQLPVNLEKKKKLGDGAQSQINFLFEYVASIYVKAKSAPSFKLESQGVKKEGTNILVTLKNAGNTHVLLKNCNVIVSDAKEKIELNLSDKEYEVVAGINVLASETRRITLPLPSKIKGEKLNIQFKLR